jgi:hypothetical protein
MRSDFIILRRRLTHIQRLGVVAAVLTIGFFGPQAQAARPMVTDDACIVDAKACQLESRVKSNHGSAEYWAQPACNFTGNLEVTLGGARFHEEGRAQPRIS